MPPKGIKLQNQDDMLIGISQLWNFQFDNTSIFIQCRACEEKQKYSNHIEVNKNWLFTEIRILPASWYVQGVPVFSDLKQLSYEEGSGRKEGWDVSLLKPFLFFLVI